MSKILGMVFLLIGAALVYAGWLAHDVVAGSLTGSVPDSSIDRSLWLLGAGAIAIAYGLYGTFKDPT